MADMTANCCIGWRNIATVAKRELYGYFQSPVAYVFVVIFLALTGFFTFMAGGFFERGEASLSWPFFSWHPWLYLFLVPAVGMRLWAEEHRLGTMELLLTMPLTAWQAIVGKFLASWAVLALALGLTFPIVLSVAFLGDPDLGAILCGYCGSLLLAGGYLAVTCMTSAMTRNQVISFILAVVALLFLILAGFPVVTDLFQKLLPGGEVLVDFIASFSVMTHFYAFQKGVLDLRDLVFFLSLIGFSLYATSVILRAQRSG